MFITPNSDLSKLKTYPRLYQTWQWYSAQCDKLNRMPSRLDIDPIEITFALGYELLSEFHRATKECRFRLIGYVVEEFTGLPTSATGLGYDEMLDKESTVRAVKTIARVVDKGQPLFGTASYRRIDGQNFGYARLICPLQQIDGEPEMVFLVLQGMHEDENFENGIAKEQAAQRWRL